MCDKLAWYICCIMMVLFVCHANLNRSPRAEEVFRRLANEAGLDIEVVSSGTHIEILWDAETLMRAWGLSKRTQLTPELLDSASKIFALDGRVLNDMVNMFGVERELVVDLGIPDGFSMGRGNISELDLILEEKLRPFIGSFGKERTG